MVSRDGPKVPSRYDIRPILIVRVNTGVKSDQSLLTECPCTFTYAI